MKHFYILLLCGWLPFIGHAQYQIRGKVVDSQGQTLSDINVLLYTLQDTTHYLKGTATDLKGEFLFSQLKAGNYKLVFSMLGHARKEEKVAIDKSTVYIPPIKLDSLACSLDEIVVKADLVSVFGNREIRLFSAEEKKRAVSGLELMEHIPNCCLII